MRILYLFIVLIFLISKIEGQIRWEVFSSNEVVFNELYNIEDGNYRINDDIVFPEFYLNDTISNRSFSPFKYTKLNEKGINTIGKQLVWDKRFDSPIKCYKDSTSISQYISIENVESFDVYIHANVENVWYRASFFVQNDGLQPPIKYSIAYLKSTQNDTVTFLDNSRKYNTIDRIIFLAHGKDCEKKSKVSINSFKISNYGIIKKPFIHPFFNKLTNENYLDFLRFNGLSQIGSMPIRLSSLAFYGIIGTETGRIIIQAHHNDSNINDASILKELSIYIFERYPFYEEKNINKSEFIQRIKSFDTKTCSYEDMADTISKYISTLHDPHFYFLSSRRNNNGKEILLNGPIALREFNNQIYVAAIFDTLLSKTIKPGIQVIKVDGIDIQEIIENEQKKYKGSPLNRRTKAISKLLYRKRNDSCTICAVNNMSDTLNSVIYYNKRNVVPSNFKPTHFDYKEYNNVSYLRLNNFVPGDWIRFYNLKEKLVKSDAIIFDLRNNGGGYEREGMRIASCFINSPQVYRHDHFFLNQEEPMIETVVLEPNSLLDLSGKKVVCLVNNRTACASEMFSSFLKSLPNTNIIGETRTSGTYARAISLTIPSGSTMTISCLEKSFPIMMQSIENKGIIPDIFVPINNVNDLYPYEDKVLKAAVQFLKNEL